MSYRLFFSSFFSVSFICPCVKESRLRLPLKAEHIEAVLDYLYADQVAGLASSEDTEFISHVLVVADQFLLSRLKVGGGIQ